MVGQVLGVSGMGGMVMLGLLLVAIWKLVRFFFKGVRGFFMIMIIIEFVWDYMHGKFN